MKVIHKYPLKAGYKIRRGRFEIVMPIGAAILSTGIDDKGDLCVWACFKKGLGREFGRVFHVFATGEDFDVSSISFVGTVYDFGFIWHVFVEGPTGGMP